MLVESQELLIDSVTDKVTQESAVEVLVALDSMLSTIRDMRNAIAREYGYSSIRPAKTDQTNEIVDVLMNGGFQVDALNSLPIDFSEVAARHGEGLGSEGLELAANRSRDRLRDMLAHLAGTN
jgi:hypothetical protein